MAAFLAATRRWRSPHDRNGMVFGHGRIPRARPALARARPLAWPFRRDADRSVGLFQFSMSSQDEAGGLRHLRGKI